MTPEADWAERKAREVAHSLPPSDFGSHRAIMAFAAALRDAVKAEREACVDMIKKKAGNWPSGSVARMVLRDVAAAIRERPL